MLQAYDEFAGWGGSSQGLAAVPCVEVALAANHAPIAVAAHAENFPHAEHLLGDVVKVDVDRLPTVEVFWASPSCPPWSDARGVRRDFDTSTQPALFGQGPDVETRKRRALMEEVPRYLRSCARRGRPVLAGVVENVTQVTRWDDFTRWRHEIEAVGYQGRVIALNAMHARPVRTPVCAQSRDRFFFAYWHLSLGRAPDWDKWLRPYAWCPTCERRVEAVQVWRPDRANGGRAHWMGNHGRQYDYRCPASTCRGQVLLPEVLPAASIIDWDADPGPRIGQRPRPLAASTRARITTGLARLARDHPTALPASIIPMRGGGSRGQAYPVHTHPVGTFSAQGLHHGLLTPPRALLVPYYGNGTPRSFERPLGTLTTRDRYALTQPPPATGGTPERVPEVDECTFRMLSPGEIRAGTAFTPTYRIPATASAKDQVAGYGNAVVPACAEVIASALVEAITGTDLPREPPTTAAAA